MDKNYGLREDKCYLEKGLPDYLTHSLSEMKNSWQVRDNGGEDPHWDCYWCELNADINTAENEDRISKKQAEYLRKEYLRMDNSEW